MYYSLSKQKVLPFPDFSSGNHQKDKFLFSFFTNGRNKSGPIILAFALSADSSNIFISFLVKTTFVASGQFFYLLRLTASTHWHNSLVDAKSNCNLWNCNPVPIPHYRNTTYIRYDLYVSMDTADLTLTISISKKAIQNVSTLPRYQPYLELGRATTKQRALPHLANTSS